MTESPITKRQFKIMILRIMTTYQGKPENKFNLLGKRSNEGALFRYLEREVSNDEKCLASVAFDELIEGDYLRMDFNQLVDTGDWVHLTEKGQHALKNETFDELDKALFALDPTLLKERDGAQEALLSHDTNSVKNAANSARELLNKVLRVIAPDEQVSQMDGFVPDADPSTRSKLGVNFAHKVRFALLKAGIQDQEEIESVVVWAKAVSKQLVANTHSTTERAKETKKDIVGQTEAILRILLLQKL